jgi:hypothetical protein
MVVVEMYSMGKVVVIMEVKACLGEMANRDSPMNKPTVMARIIERSTIICYHLSSFGFCGSIPCGTGRNHPSGKL